jgi:membrane-bound lytic murein transglycosylase
MSLEKNRRCIFFRKNKIERKDKVKVRVPLSGDFDRFRIQL